MSKEQILDAIANYCQNKQLIFQVIVRDTEAHIYANRQVEDDVDYFQLCKTKIRFICQNIGRSITYNCGKKKAVCREINSDRFI